MGGNAHCPDAHVLRQFLHGELSPEDLAKVERHLLNCTPCCTQAERLCGEDSLFSALELSMAEEEPPQLQRAASLAKGLFRQRETLSLQTDETLPGQPAPSREIKTQELLKRFPFFRKEGRPSGRGRLGTYRLLGVLGQGGMGVVLKAEDTQLGRQVALKLIRPELAQNAKARQRFLREAQAMAAVEHPNIVPIYQVGQEQGIPFLVMPLLQGETLAQRLRRETRLPALLAVDIARQVASALAAAHRRGLIHRDVKPGNIWLEPNDQVRLLDFGLVRPAQPNLQVTQAGSVLGTPHYMSPEQAQGETVTPQADLFSLGAVLYQMLSGRLPFPGKTTGAVLAAVLYKDPLPLDRHCPELPPELVTLVHQLLAKDVQARPQDAAEVSSRLQAIQQRMANHADKASPKEKAAPSSQEKPPWGHPPQENALVQELDSLLREQQAGASTLPSGPGAFPAPLGERSPWDFPRHKGRNRLLVWFPAVAAGSVGLMLLAMLMVFFLRTKHGVVRVEINDPDIQVTIKDTQLVFKQSDSPQQIRLRPGRHTLIVTRGQFRFETDQFILRKGDRVTLRVDWLPGELVIRQNDRLLARAPLPAPKETKPPARPPSPPEKDHPRPADPQQGAASATLPAGDRNAPSSSSLPHQEPPPGKQPPVAVAPFDATAARGYQAAWAHYLELPVEKEVQLGPGVTMRFVLIPPGEFEMGITPRELRAFMNVVKQLRSYNPEFSPEKDFPAGRRRVRIERPFYLAQTELTRAQFRRFVEATSYQTFANLQGAVVWFTGGRPRRRIPEANWRNPFLPQTDEHPVVCVTARDAQAFCSWLRQRFGLQAHLPSNAQWEFACRAGSTSWFYVGNDPHELSKTGNVYINPELSQKDGFLQTAPVGQLQPNPWQLFDMYGNVNEWTIVDPKGEAGKSVPFGGPSFSLRGGGWLNGLSSYHSAYAAQRKWNLCSNLFGFRVALRIPQCPPIRWHDAPPANCGMIQVKFQGTDEDLEIWVQGRPLVLDTEHSLRNLKLKAGSVQLIIRLHNSEIPCKSFQLRPGTRESVRVIQKGEQILVIRNDNEQLAPSSN